MARINIDRTRGLPDIISTGEYEFLLGRIPGWGTDRDLIVKAQQVTYPGDGNEAYEVPLHGFVSYFRGRKTFPRQLSVTYVEDRFFNTTRAFRAWSEFIVGTRSGTSAGYKNQYALSRCDLITYDPTGQAIDRTTFVGLFPQDRPDVQYDGSSSQPYLVNVTFVYDYFVSSSTPVR